MSKWSLKTKIARIGLPIIVVLIVAAIYIYLTPFTKIEGEYTLGGWGTPGKSHAHQNQAQFAARALDTGVTPLEAAKKMCMEHNCRGIIVDQNDNPIELKHYWRENPLTAEAGAAGHTTIALRPNPFQLWFHRLFRGITPLQPQTVGSNWSLGNRPTEVINNF